jgi:hypothetical protein
MNRRTRLLLLLTLVALPLGIAGCVQSTRTALISADWSRGAWLGNSTSADTPAMALSPGEDLLLLVWPAQAESESVETLRLLALDTTSGVVASEQDVSTPSSHPRVPVLIPAGQDSFHLLWLDGLYTERAIYHTFLGPDGAPVGKTSRISPSDLQVIDMRAALLPDGGLMVLWTSQPSASPFRLDLYLLRLDAEGQPLSPSLLLSEVLSADMAVDSQGTIHLAWLEQATIRRYLVRYAELQPDDTVVSASRDVATIFLRDTQTGRDINGPILALERDNIYFTWVWATQGGERLAFVFAEGGEIPDSEPQPVYLSPSFPPACMPVEGVPGLTCMASPLLDIMGSALVHQVSVAKPNQQGQTVLALSLWERTRNRETLQPALAILDGGRLLGHTVAAWTSRPSVGVAAVADDAGNLYVGWVDATGVPDEHPVYLTTTSTAMRPALNRLTAMDVLASFIDAGHRMVQGVIFVPWAAMWGVLPLAWLLVALRRSGGDPRGRTACWILLIAVGLHWAGKYLLTHDLLSSLPRLAFAPPVLVPLLVYLTPVATVTLGMALTRLLYIRRRPDEFSPMLAYLFVALTDVIISTSLYGLAFTE